MQAGGYALVVVALLIQDWEQCQRILAQLVITPPPTSHCWIIVLPLYFNIIHFLLSFSTKSGHRGSRSPWRWQGRGICTSRSRRRIWKRMLRMYLAAIKDVLRMLLLPSMVPSTEVAGSDQEAKSSSTWRGWTWIAKTRCISSCLECWMLNVDVEVAYMSIVALPAPMAAVSRYLCGVKACTKIDLK